jgi:DUF4097 and DUF4098 domain-containing protein YvlB
MSKTQSNTRNYGRIAWFAIAALVIPWSLVHASRAIQETRQADPKGEVEIVNVAGDVVIEGWDRNEVEVSGKAGDGVDRVDVTSSRNRTSIQVVMRSHTWSDDGEAHLVVHVPAQSSVRANLVSANFKVTGVTGDMKVQTVSGNVHGEAGGDLRATTVSGNVQVSARAAKTIEVKTISGDIHLTGGGGEVDVTTVSGKATIELAEVNRARFKSISGDLIVALGLATDALIESESVSGDISLKFASMPAAQFDVEAFSGDIKNCFGPKPMEARYGPGSRLDFKNGEGHGQVRVNTKSGDVRLCVNGMDGTHVSELSLAQVVRHGLVVPYVF